MHASTSSHAHTHLSPSSADDVLPPPSSSPAHKHKLKNHSVVTPRRRPWLSRSVLPPRSSFSETTDGCLRSLNLSPEIITTKQTHYCNTFDTSIDSTLITSCLSLSLPLYPTLRTEGTPFRSPPRATSTPRRLSLDPSAHSRSASISSLSRRPSTFLPNPDTSLLFDGHSGIPI